MQWGFNPKWYIWHRDPHTPHRVPVSPQSGDIPESPSPRATSQSPHPHRLPLAALALSEGEEGEENRRGH